MVAPQSLNLLVGVRVPIPQPNKAPIAKVMGALSCILEKLPLALMHNACFSARGARSPKQFPDPLCCLFCVGGVAEGGKAEIALAAFSESNSRRSYYLLFV